MKELMLNLNLKKKKVVRNNEYHLNSFLTMFNKKQDEFDDLVNDIFECNYYHNEDEFGALHTNLIELIKCLEHFLTWNMTDECYQSGLLLKKRYQQLKDQVIKYVNWKGR